jgi:hypothetical protein
MDAVEATGEHARRTASRPRSRRNCSPVTVKIISAPRQRGALPDEVDVRHGANRPRPIAPKRIVGHDADIRRRQRRRAQSATRTGQECVMATSVTIESGTATPEDDAFRGEAAEFAARLAGDLVQPHQDPWDQARQAWNLAVDQRPELVVQAGSAADVVETIRFAHAHGLRVAPQATGHHAAPIAELRGTILLRTDRMRAVTVDPARRSVRAEAGAQWNDVATALAPHGLVGLSGSSGDVGVVGYTLGGGCSWFGREYGLACNSVTALELVTGDGRTHRVTADSEPDLFWAVRGGAGNAAVVTAIEFAAYPATEVYAGMTLFPIARAQEVFQTFAGWAQTLPDQASVCVRLLRLPPLPDIPEPLRGNAFVGVDGVFNLPADEAAALVAPLRALGPTIDTFAPIAASTTGQVHMDPPEPVPGCGEGMLLTALPDDAIDAILAVAGPHVDCPLLAVDVRLIGGAIGRPDPAGGAVNHLPGQYLLYAVGIAPVPPAQQQVAAALDALTTALRPWDVGRDYGNFRESPAPAERFYPTEVLARLHEIQRRYDPDRTIRAAHPWAADAS